MKKIKKEILIIIIVIIFIFFTCIILSNILERIIIEKSYGDEKNSANQYAKTVTMIELISNPQKYHNKLVRVIGVGNLEFEGDAIYLNKEDLQYRTDNCIWIELGERSIEYSEAKEYNGKYVIIEGYFNKNNTGHFGQFCGAIEKVSRYQLWEIERDM